MVSQQNTFSGHPTKGFRECHAGEKVGIYQLIEMLGQGGMGQVWKARDTQGDRPVALKLLPPEFRGNEEAIAQVRLAFQTVHDLTHQCLCKMIALGDDPIHGAYLVMDYIPGITLSKYRRSFPDGRLPLDLVVSILRPVAEALDYAHQRAVHATDHERRGVLHRDVKPQNIMLCLDGDSIARVCLIDLGLAAEIRSTATRFTQAHVDTRGTRPYMSPEQLSGKRSQWDGRTDQYSLAVVAYELLAGRPPFEGDDGILIHAIESKQPDPIEGSSSAVNEALFKALAKTRDKRFGSCAEFVNALNKLPSSANGPSIMLSTSSSADRIRRKNIKLPNLAPGLYRQVQGNCVGSWRVQAGDKGCPVAFTHDGRLLINALDNWQDGSRFVNLADSKLDGYISRGDGGGVNWRTMQHHHSIAQVAFSPDDELVVTSSFYKVLLVSLKENKVIANLGDFRTSVGFSPDGRFIATATGHGKTAAYILSVPDGRCVATLQGHGHSDHSGWGVETVAFSPDAKLLATGGGDGTVRIWTVPDGRAVSTFKVGGWIQSVAFSPDGTLIAAGHNSYPKGVTSIWNVREGRCVATLEGGTYSVAFSPDGALLATGAHKGTNLWSIPNYHFQGIIGDHTDTVTSVAFSPDGRFIATGGKDCQVNLWFLCAQGEEVDWSSSQPLLPPRAKISLISSGDGVVYAGDYLWTQFTLENTGKGEYVQLSARLKSSSPFLPRGRATIGKVKAGEQAERCFATLLPVDAPAGPVEGQLVFHEPNGFAPPPQSVTFTVHSLPRSDFPVSWRLVNDDTGNSSGNGDGQPKRGESVDVVVAVENQTGEDLDGLRLALKALTALAGVAVCVPFCELGTVRDGRATEGRVTVSIKPTAAVGQARFELRVESGDGRTLAVVPVETTIA